MNPESCPGHLQYVLAKVSLILFFSYHFFYMANILFSLIFFEKALQIRATTVAVVLVMPLLVAVAVAVALLALLPWERFLDHQISSQTKGG